MTKNISKVVDIREIKWHEVVISYFLTLAWTACVMAIIDYFIIMLYGVKVFFT